MQLSQFLNLQRLNLNKILIGTKINKKTIFAGTKIMLKPIKCTIGFPYCFYVPWKHDSGVIIFHINKLYAIC